MKTKLLITAALIGAVGLSAHAGVFVGISLPFPRVVVPAPQVVVTGPVVETVPACPGPDYVWVPGYWSGYGSARVWVAGCWQPPVPVVYSYPYRGYDDRGHYDRGDNDRGHNDRGHNDRGHSDRGHNDHDHGGRR